MRNHRGVEDAAQHDDIDAAMADDRDPLDVDRQLAGALDQKGLASADKSGLRHDGEGGGAGAAGGSIRDFVATGPEESAVISDGELISAQGLFHKPTIRFGGRM